MIKTSLCPSFERQLADEVDERSDRDDQRKDGGEGGISNYTMVKQYKAHFSYRILQNGKNIYIHNIKT